MSCGFYLTSPFIYLNMGCEMMFVLSNRLHAQNIDMGTVGSKILSDVTQTLCKPEFVARMMQPQAPLSIPTFYELLTKIVNCSSMKLDKASMEKLFYLILMTFKKQLFLCSSPLELYSLTRVHFEDLLAMLKHSPLAQQNLHKSLQIFDSQARHYSYLQYLEIREEILSMLESYKSRIVLFVEVGLQAESGEMLHFNRASHCNRAVGMGINHPDVDFSLPKSTIPKKKLDYREFLQWRTDLGKDDYDNIRGSSKFASAKEIEKTESERSISDFLKIGDLKLDAYEVKMDIFDDGTSNSALSQQKPKEAFREQPPTMTMAVDITNKIEQEFAALGVEEEEAEVDLLEMMDG